MIRVLRSFGGCSSFCVTRQSATLETHTHTHDITMIKGNNNFVKNVE